MIYTDMDFRNFLINEDTEYLSVRMSDILNALQDLNQEVKSMGMRQVVKSTETIINQIRRILHSNWPKEEDDTLKQLQKIGVALAKSVEDKDNLEGTLQAAQQALENVMGETGSPANQLGEPEGVERGDEQPEAPPQGKTEQPPPQMQQPMQPQMQPPM